jgi:hypothetical protein
MVLLILVVLWAVVLTPHFVRKWLDRRPAGSIESFHHQLHLLERTGPKLVSPAYRLETAVPGGSASASGALPPVAGRANLVLLAPVGSGGSGEGDEVIDEASGEHYRRLPTPVQPAPAVELTAAPSAGELRHFSARRRRRDLVLGLMATMALTGLAGFAHTLHVLWVLTALAGLALAGFVGLAAYAQVLETQGDQPRHAPRHGAASAPRHAAAGYPGAWDDDDPADDGGYEYQQAAAGR